MENASSGNPFRWRASSGGDNKFHVITVEMTHRFTINDYSTNSRLVHAISDKPAGPYRFSSVFRAPFAHAAHSTYAPDGTLLVV
eukprot:SAG31_NODE_17671_length_662_cov_0.683837_2_plen_83_part_01